jgi:hypothetical protein
MTAEQELPALERAFWSEIADTDFYRAHITDNAVMVFPAPYGIMDYDAILEAVEGATRWEECTFSDFQLVELTDDSAVVAYRADARRPNGPMYATFATSTYVRQAGSWRLAVHQQTPIPDNV